jgi:hypothetical protein
VVAADKEDDSIDIAISEGDRRKGVDASRQEPWSELIGKAFRLGMADHQPTRLLRWDPSELRRHPPSGASERRGLVHQGRRNLLMSQ